MLSILVRKLSPAVVRLLNIPNTKKTYSFMFLRQTLSCYNLKVVLLLNLIVKVLVLFNGTRTRVHFSISVLVLEVFCGTRTRRLSTRLHHWKLLYEVVVIRRVLRGALCHSSPFDSAFFCKKEQNQWCQVIEILQTLLMVSVAYGQVRIQRSRMRGMHLLTSHFQNCFCCRAIQFFYDFELLP